MRKASCGRVLGQVRLDQVLLPLGYLHCCDLLALFIRSRLRPSVFRQMLWHSLRRISPKKGSLIKSGLATQHIHTLSAVMCSCARHHYLPRSLSPLDWILALLAQPGWSWPGRSATRLCAQTPTQRGQSSSGSEMWAATLDVS